VKVLEKADAIDASGGTAVFVVHDDPQAVREGLLRGLEVPFPVLLDPQRRGYAAWGMRRSSVAGVWLDPRVWARYAGQVARGERLLRLGEDTLQLGGDFVVDPAGVVVYARPQRRDDRPPVLALLAEVERAGRVASL
jgi:hypothetical protein